MIGNQLIDADRTLKLCTFLKRCARKDVSCLPRMNPNSRCVLVEQSIDHIDLGLKRFKWRKRFSELNRTRVFRVPIVRISNLSLRPPMIGIHATCHEENAKTIWKL